MHHRDEQGQAAAELALVVPLLVLLLLAVVQVTLVARDQVLVVHAAREAAREAAVDPRPASVRQAALRAAGTGMKASRLGIETRQTGGAPVIVIVRVAYRAPTEVPLIGPLLPDVEVRAKAAMRRESPAELGESPMQDGKPAGRPPSRGEPSGENLGSGPGTG